MERTPGKNRRFYEYRRWLMIYLEAQKKINEDLAQWLALSIHYAELGNRESLSQLGVLAVNFPLPVVASELSPILLAMRISADKGEFDFSLQGKIRSVFEKMFPGVKVVFSNERRPSFGSSEYSFGSEISEDLEKQ